MQGAPWHQPGGADDFLAFLTKDLRDDLSRRFPVNPSRHILSGHSFGGLFALRVLLSRPESFQKYIALSPSIWWDDRRLLKEIDEGIRQLPDDRQTDVLIAVGADETPGRPRISKFMVADVQHVAELLSQAKARGKSISV